MDTHSGIRLNGDGAVEHDSETFHLPGSEEGFISFPGDECVTNGMPYADVVTAILISAFTHQGTVFTSDGRWKGWTEGVRLFELAVRPLTADELLTLGLSAEGLLQVPARTEAELWPDGGWSAQPDSQR